MLSKLVKSAKQLCSLNNASERGASVFDDVDDLFQVALARVIIITVTTTTVVVVTRM